MSIAAGAAYWGLVPYTPEAPFLVRVAGGEPVEVPGVESFVEGLGRGGDAEFRFVVRAKTRPVLLLSDRQDQRTGDLFALRLLRMERLSAAEQAAVRDHREPTLFHLRVDNFPGLSRESAAVVSAPVRLHNTALDTRRRVGALDENELRVLHERFATYWRLDLHQLLLGKIEELRRRVNP